jgi:hypothetical protein
MRYNREGLHDIPEWCITKIGPESLDGTNFSAIDGTITTALHTPKTLVCRVIAS